jgi:hypothetical protein
MAYDPYAYLDEMDNLAAAPKFSVGQRVRVTEDEAADAGVREGDEGVVEVAKPNDYEVCMDDGETWFFNDVDIEAVDAKARDADEMNSWTAPEDAPDHLSALLDARGSRYGSFEDNSVVSQNVKGAIHAGDKWIWIAPDQAEALDMISAKISRIVTGDPDYADNWDDIAGYAKLVADRLRRDAAGTPEGAR